MRLRKGRLADQKVVILLTSIMAIIFILYLVSTYNQNATDFLATCTNTEARFSDFLEGMSWC